MLVFNEVWSVCLFVEFGGIVGGLFNVGIVVFIWCIGGLLGESVVLFKYWFKIYVLFWI